MTDDERKQMKDLQLMVDRQSKLIQELIYAITGNPTLGNDGLIGRLKTLESIRDNQQRDFDGFKEFIYRQVDMIEGNLDTKFNILNSNIDSKFVGMDSFRREIGDFKTRFDMFFGVVANKSTWLFLFKLVTVITVIGGLLIGWYKGGYEAFVNSLKQLLGK